MAGDLAIRRWCALLSHVSDMETGKASANPIERALIVSAFGYER